MKIRSMKTLIIALLLLPHLAFSQIEEPIIDVQEQRVVEERVIREQLYNLQDGKLTIEYYNYIPSQKDNDKEERYYIEIPYEIDGNNTLTSESIAFSCISGRKMITDENSRIKKLSLTIIKKEKTVLFKGTLDYIPPQGEIDTFSNELRIDMEIPIKQDIVDKHYFYIDRSLDAYHYQPIKEEPTEFPDKEPEFPGGMQALMKYMNKNLKYPKVCSENGIEGRVYLSFIIEKDGSVTEVKLLRGVHSALDKEAIRLTEEMPNWIPGQMDDGRIVRSIYRIPIVFRLSN